MLMFDIGANRGDATFAALEKGYKVIACEPAFRVFGELVKNFIYNPNVIPLKVAVSDTDDSTVEFYEADEDGLSTLNKDWLTKDNMPYKDKPFRLMYANTITVDSLAVIYGHPDLIKIDVEGAEWNVFNGMSYKYGTVTFEWTDVTLEEHEKQIQYLKELGYTEVGPQFITHHLQEPTEWFPIDNFSLTQWVKDHEEWWVNEGWKESNLRPTADVGMCWVR